MHFLLFIVIYNETRVLYFYVCLSNDKFLVLILCCEFYGNLIFSDWIGLNKVYRPTKHITGHIGDGFLWVK